jgi:hypothetical protein
MPPAVIGGVIAGVGAIGASVIGSKANSKAIGQASDAQTAASQQATALQREIYQQNVGYQTPYLNTGNAAMAQINALLGLQVPQAAPAAQPVQTNPGSQQGPVGGLPGPLGIARLDMWRDRIANGYNINDAPQMVRNALLREQQAQQSQAAPPMTTPPISQPTAQAAYDQFKNYTGYQYRLNEGQNAINSGYAAKGTLQSGAAMLALQKHGQDYASGEFGNYMGYLTGQQQLGPGAANALGGVGTNYANNAGNIAMQNGNNLANAAIARANNTNQMWSGIASGIGGIAGSMFGGSSYGGRP